MSVKPGLKTWAFFEVKRSDQCWIVLVADALERSVEEWQPVLAEFIPGIKVLSTFGHDWGGDDLSQGSWCTYRPGTVSRFTDELPRQEGNLFYASGDHAQGWRGFTEGAISSGSRTAVQVNESFST